jgi:hypothetical protein
MARARSVSAGLSGATQAFPRPQRSATFARARPNRAARAVGGDVDADCQQWARFCSIELENRRAAPSQTKFPDPQRGASVSSQIVKGPSLMSWTRISAPKTPVSTVPTPDSRTAEAKRR